MSNSTDATLLPQLIIDVEKKLQEANTSLMKEKQQLKVQIGNLNSKVCLFDLVSCCCFVFLKLSSAPLSPQFLSVPNNKILEGRKILKCVLIRNVDCQL